LVSVVAAGDIRRGSELVSDLAVVAEVQRLEGAPKVVKRHGAIVIIMRRLQLADNRPFEIPPSHNFLTA
jgi:hypothetical protein